MQDLSCAPCVRPYILLYIHGPDILFVLLCKYHKITQIQNDRLAAILKLFAPKG